MSGTTPGSYLVIARYGPANWARWKETDHSSKADARSHAMNLFPLRPDPLPRGMEMVHTFHTGAHAEIPDDFNSKTAQEQIAILDSIFAEQRDKAPGTIEKDPLIGWVAVIYAENYDAFINQQMGGKANLLWTMYDIEVIPLNADLTTQNIYDFMTIVHWAVLP